MTEDLRATDQGSILIVAPLTAAGRDWALMNTDWDPLSPVLAVDHRYGPDLLLGAHQSGLAVTLDGRLADVDR